MTPKHLIFSGCSFTFGSGFIDEAESNITNDEKKPIFMHPGLEKKYQWETYKIAKEEVKKISYPLQVGKELDVSAYNLAIQGFGIDSHLQKLTAFILENKYNIDFSKGEGIVMYQVADFSRMEFWDIHSKNKTGLSGAGQFEDVPPFLKDYFIYSYNFEYQVYKYLIQLIHFKGFCESRGINFHPYSFDGSYLWDIHTQITSEINWEEEIPKVWSWEHEKTILPNIKELIKELNPISVNPYKYVWDDAYSPIHATFGGAGYHDDAHFTEEGHKLIAKGLIEFLKQEYSYGKH